MRNLFKNGFYLGLGWKDFLQNSTKTGWLNLNITFPERKRNNCNLPWASSHSRGQVAIEKTIQYSNKLVYYRGMIWLNQSPFSQTKIESISKFLHVIVFWENFTKGNQTEKQKEKKIRISLLLTLSIRKKGNFNFL